MIFNDVLWTTVDYYNSNISGLALTAVLCKDGRRKSGTVAEVASPFRAEWAGSPPATLLAKPQALTCPQPTENMRSIFNIGLMLTGLGSPQKSIIASSRAWAMGGQSNEFRAKSYAAHELPVYSMLRSTYARTAMLCSAVESNNDPQDGVVRCLLASAQLTDHYAGMFSAPKICQRNDFLVGLR